MTMTIRAAEKRDALAVAELIAEVERFYAARVKPPEPPLEERRREVEEALFGSPPIASALLAVDGAGGVAALAAYSFLWPAAWTSHSLFLKELYIRDAARGKGLGTRMMRELRDIAAARPGCSRIEWTSDTGNPDARAFYRALGFTELEGKVIYRMDAGTA